MALEKTYYPKPTTPDTDMFSPNTLPNSMDVQQLNIFMTTN